MNIKNNDYELSTFPDAEESFCVAKYTYTYAPQNDILIDPIIYVDEIIDFSSEVNTKGILAESAATTFTWRNATGELLIENEDYEVVSDGIFKFIKAQDEHVLCQFSSAAFPKLKDSDILKTTLATVKENAPVSTFTTEKTTEMTRGLERNGVG